MSAVIFKNSLASKMKIIPVGTVTLTGSEQTLQVVNMEDLGGVRNLLLVIAGATLAGAGNTFTVYGSTVANGTSNFTKIAQVTLGSSDNECYVQVDAEDISQAAEAAGLLPEGFKSLVCRADGTNADTVNATVIVLPFHEQNNLTPTDTTTLT